VRIVNKIHTSAYTEEGKVKLLVCGTLPATRSVHSNVFKDEDEEGESFSDMLTSSNAYSPDPASY
jgi:hypothetical protein